MTEIVNQQPPPSSGKTLRQLIESKQQDMARVATKFMTADALVKLVGVAMSKVPHLAECTPLSVLQSMMTLAQLGLSPNTPAGEAYLIPYWNKRIGAYECQLIVGYRGMVLLARRYGDVAHVQAELVRAGDVFELEYGYEPRFRHIPRGDSSADVIKAWALAKMQDGTFLPPVVMSAAEIDAIRNRSKASDSGPWVTDPGEMSKKTVIRRLCKSLSLSPELAEKIEAADRTEFEVDLDIAGQVTAAADAEAAPPTALDVAKAAAKAASRPAEAPPTEDPEPNKPPHEPNPEMFQKAPPRAKR